MTTTKKTAAKKAASKAPAQPSSIDKVAKDVLKKLHTLGIEEKLQADLEWCLGSYSFDKNPAGLYEMLGKADRALRKAQEKNPKAVTTKLLKDLGSIVKK